MVFENNFYKTEVVLWQSIETTYRSYMMRFLSLTAGRLDSFLKAQHGEPTLLGNKTRLLGTALAKANRQAIKFVSEIRNEFENENTEMVISCKNQDLTV
ncbi:MAG TPA: hypothetical protein VF540_07420 [Segetibacter sp.]|jgi:hypothetical protein